MGWLFRKSFKIFPGVRANFGKKGFTSLTIGKGGWFSTNVNTKGIRHNINVPGTGITYQTPRTGGVGPPPANPQRQLYNYEALNTQVTQTWHCDRCGNLNPQQNNFCGNCGHSGMEVTSSRMPELAAMRPADNSTRNALLIVGGITAGLLSICVICGGILGTAPRTANRPAAFVSTSPTPNISPSPVPVVKSQKPTAPISRPRKTPVPSPTPSSSDIYDATTPVPTSPSRRSAAGGYTLGPRGGCYYINSHGNKTYVDHSYCN